MIKALILTIAAAGAIAVICGVILLQSEDKATTPTTTTTRIYGLYYENADGRPPKCDKTVCNTSPAIVDISQVALDRGGKPALKIIKRQLLNTCMASGQSLSYCSKFITGTVIPLVIYNLAHGMPKKGNGWETTTS